MTILANTAIMVNMPNLLLREAEQTERLRSVTRTAWKKLFVVLLNAISSKVMFSYLLRRLLRQPLLKSP
jgi:hypothetical protein